MFHLGKNAPKKKPASRSQNEQTTQQPDTELINQTRLSPPATATRRAGATAAMATITVDCDAEELHRTMDPDVMLLFEEKLLLKYPMTQNTIGTALGVLEFK